MTFRMDFRWMLAAAALLAAVGTVSAQGATKIGVFDAQRVSEETAEGRKVQEQLAAFRDRKQGEIRDKQQAVAELEKQLTQQALSLSSEKRSEMEKRIQLQALELQTAQESARREMQLEFQAASDGFQKKLETVVAQIGRDEGFVILLDRGLVAWAADSIDVTTTIVDRFDKAYPVAKP